MSTDLLLAAILIVLILDLLDRNRSVDRAKRRMKRYSRRAKMWYKRKDK